MSESDDELLGATVTPHAARSATDEASLPVAPSDRYLVERELGSGGQSVVFAARDSVLNREVALKTARDHGEAATGFVREARITGQLEHPGIVPVHELGRTSQGEVFVTQKLVRGRSLRKALDDATTLDARLKLVPHFIDLAHAVAYAHARGVVHRDLKPENVMVGEFGETVLLDWGVARVLGDDETFALPPENLSDVKPLQTVRRLEGVISSGSTRRGAIVGTPLYMSPEQARGDNEHVDARSDVWSLGVMLYELLAFTRPFHSTDVRALLTEVAHGRMTPLADAAPEAPPELVAIVAQALQPERERRVTAKALAEQLTDFRAGKRVAAYQYTSFELFKRFVTQNRALTLVSLAALIALGCSELYAWNLVHQRDDALSDAQSNLQRSTLGLVDKSMLSRDWSSAAALLDQLADGGMREAGIAARALDEWVAPSTVLPGRLEWTATRAAIDGRTGTAIAASPGHGVALIKNDGWNALAPPVRADAAPSVAIAPGGGAWAYRTSSVFISGTQATEAENVQLLALSGDGLELAMAGPGHVWTTPVVQPDALKSFDGAPAMPMALAASPKHGVVAVSGHDGTLRWWNESGPHELRNDEAYVKLAFSTDATLLFAADRAYRIDVIDLTLGARVHTLEGHRFAVSSLAVSSQDWLASASASGSIMLWDLRTWRPLSQLSAPGFSPLALAFDEAGTQLYGVDEDGVRRVWDLTKLLSHRELARLPSAANALTVDSAGGIWALTREGLHRIPAEGQQPLALADVKGASLLAVEDGVLVGAQGRLELRGILDGSVTVSGSPCPATTWALARAKDASDIWAACGTAVVQLDAETLKPEQTPIQARATIKHLAISPDGAYLAWAAEDGAGALVELASLHEEERWSGAVPEAIAFSPDSAQLLVVTDSGATIRSGTTGVELRKLFPKGDIAAAAAGFAAGHHAAWVAGGERLTLWPGVGSYDLPGLHLELTAAHEVAGALIVSDVRGALFRYALPQ